MLLKLGGTSMTTGVIAAMVPAAAPSALRLILLMVEPVSTMFLVVESRALRYDAPGS
nr:hypothetical protein [Xanthomonas oryzae]